MWQALIPLFSELLNRVLPDKAQADTAKLKLLELTQAGVLAELDAQVKLAVGQMEVNKVEASSVNPFVSGWRPAAGWVCVLALGSQFVFGPFAEWASAIVGNPVQWPMLDFSQLLPILLGMLGLVGARTTEKIKDVARD